MAYLTWICAHSTNPTPTPQEELNYGQWTRSLTRVPLDIHDVCDKALETLNNICAWASLWVKLVCIIWLQQLSMNHTSILYICTSCVCWHCMAIVYSERASCPFIRPNRNFYFSKCTESVILGGLVGWQEEEQNQKRRLRMGGGHGDRRLHDKDMIDIVNENTMEMI